MQRVLRGDSRRLLRRFPDGCFDAVVTDPPYGLEFMGSDWDSFGDIRQPGDANFTTSEAGPFKRAKVRHGGTPAYGDRWRDGAGMTAPGIGERRTEWPSFGGRDTANATCATCGGRERGALQCPLEGSGPHEPDWRVKGESTVAMGTAGAAFQTWCAQWAGECLRVLKPGGYLLAFGGTRTYHRMVCAVEDAGFEIRDSIHWVQGTGFPKSMNVSAAIDRQLGRQGSKGGFKTPQHAVHRQRPVGAGHEGWQRPWMDDPDAVETFGRAYLPASDEARQWDGWGTALSPSHEPILVARRPFRGTLASNLLAGGMGALHIDATRTRHRSDADRDESEAKNRHADFGSGPRDNQIYGSDGRDRAEQGNYDGSAGRWPSNFVLSHSQDCELIGSHKVKGITGTANGKAIGNDTGTIYGHGWKGGAYEKGTPIGYADADGMETVESWQCAADCPVRALDEQSGIRGPGHTPAARGVGGISTSGHKGQADLVESYTESGGASRFFPCFHYHAKAADWERAGATHPTVKPIDLMRWLLRLVVPEGGCVLDPFAGSGSTLIAAAWEGFNAIGVEKDREFARQAKARLRRALADAQFGAPPIGTKPASATAPQGQESLF